MQLCHQLCLHNSLLKTFIKLLWPWKLKMSLKTLWPCKCKVPNPLPEFIAVEFEISTQKPFFWLEGSKNCPWNTPIFSFEAWPTVDSSSCLLFFLVPPQLEKAYSVWFAIFLGIYNTQSCKSWLDSHFSKQKEQKDPVSITLLIFAVHPIKITRALFEKYELFEMQCIQRSTSYLI